MTGMGISELLKLAVTVAALIGCAIGYAVALRDVKAGRLVVYLNWTDLLKSSVWIVLFPLGFVMLTDSAFTVIGRVLGVGISGCGLISMWWMIRGAFQNNSGVRCWLALFARFAGSVLILLSLGKLHEKAKRYLHDDKEGGLQSRIFPLAIIASVYAFLIRPMIGSGRVVKCRNPRIRKTLNLKGAAMSKKAKLGAFLDYLKEKVPGIGGAKAEEYYSLGLKYYKGSGVARDKHLSFVCFEHAARKGLLDAQYRVGMAYDNGDGVLADKYAAFKWYLKAAERGHAKAQMCVGYAYRNGEGCEESVREAFKWYLKAAEQDESTAQNNLAMMYECGVGVAKDVDKARYWYKKSIENGNATATDNLQDMEQKLVKGKGAAKDAKEHDESSTEVPVTDGASCDVDLKSLVGLDPVKKAVSDLRDFIAYQIECGKRGLPVTQISNHCVFTGNPGTGKTTVARIIAKIYHEMGILKTSKVVEVDRSRVVGEYIGHTAKQMSRVIDEAMDGVLFIDEAYSLAEGGEKDFGREAVEVLLKRMDDNRDRLVVIVAGYTDEMHKFIEMNPGLKSRFTHYIEFPDYSAEELVRIFLSMCEKEKYVCDDEVRAVLRNRMAETVKSRDRTFGNARFVRNVYEDAQRRIASRLAGVLSKSTDSELKTFIKSDVQ